MKKNLASVLCVVLSLCTFVGAQSLPGTPNFSAVDSHRFDAVDLMTNNVLLSVPVRAKAGALPFNASLNGNYSILGAPSTGLYSSQNPGIGNGITVLQLSVDGWLSANASVGATYTSTIVVSCPVSGTTTKYWGWVVTDSLGTVHPLLNSLYSDKTSGGTSCLSGSGFTATTLDNSGITVQVQANGTGANSIYDKSGT